MVALPTLRTNQDNPGNTPLPLGGITNLDYTVLLCTKMDETRAFYRDVMQFPIETDQKNWCSFRVGAALLTLRPRGWSHFEDGKSVPGSAAVQLAFRVPPPAIDACHAENAWSPSSIVNTSMRDCLGSLCGARP